MRFKTLRRKILIFSSILILVFLSLILNPNDSFSHSGRTDSYGCHHDRKHGGYHCHSGPLAGQSFSSKEEMIQKLQSMKKTGEGKKAGDAAQN
jgi:hypothetical protein